MHVTVDGRRIGFDDTGGTGVPLVLLHGFPLDRTSWDDVMPALAGIRVIRPDLRGCGESEPGDGPALMESLAGDVAALLDALEADRAIVAGHSIGGYVALAFFRMYEERVAGLGLVASHVNADASRAPAIGEPLEVQRALAASRDAMAERLEREGTMDAAIESYLPRYFAPALYRQRPALVERLRAMMARQNAAGCAQLQRGMMERLASDDLLADVRVPALVVAGAQDAYITAASLRETAAAMSGAVFVELDGVGHLPQMEDPRRTGAALARLAQVPNEPK